MWFAPFDAKKNYAKDLGRGTWDTVTFLLLKAQRVTSRAEAAAHISKASQEARSMPARRFKSAQEWLHFKKGQLAAIASFEDLARTRIDDSSSTFKDRLSYDLPENTRIHFDDNSWIILTAHSMHESDGVGDMILGIASDGSYYLNRGHVCGGIILEAKKEIKSLSDFLETIGFGGKKESRPWMKHVFDESSQKPPACDGTSNAHEE